MVVPARVILAMVLMVVGLVLAPAIVVWSEDTDVPRWVAALDDADPAVRRQAARLLGQLGPAAKDAVGNLAKSLKDEDPSVRAEAARALGQIGPGARPAVGRVS